MTSARPLALLAVSGSLRATGPGGAIALDGSDDSITVRVEGFGAFKALYSWWKNQPRERRRVRISLASRASAVTGVRLRVIYGMLAAELSPDGKRNWLGSMLGGPAIRVGLSKASDRVSRKSTGGSK